MVDTPKNVTAGQEFEIIIEIFSNSYRIVKDFLLEADYPFGFDFKDSNIKPSYRDNIWNFGDIAPNSKRILKRICFFGGGFGTPKCTQWPFWQLSL